MARRTPLFVAADEVCCPLTKLCVIPGVECTPPPVCTSSEYCCPDALHCLTPVEPGTLCGGACSGWHTCALPLLRAWVRACLRGQREKGPSRRSASTGHWRPLSLNA